MEIKLKEQNNKITPGCIVIDKDNESYLIAENELDPPCKCSEHMGEGYVLIKLDGFKGTPTVWSIFSELEHIRECISVVKVIQPENILLKEI